MRSRIDRKICGTCEFWKGKRSPIFDKNEKPKVEIIDEFGKCDNIHYKRFYQKIRRKDVQCQCYENWIKK